MAEAGDGSGHTPLTPEWTPAPRASHYPWQGDRPAAAPSMVRWNGITGAAFPVLCGVRQGGIWSPILFAIYVDSLISDLRQSGYGLYIGALFVGCVVYADDIVLLSVSCFGLQRLVDMWQLWNSVGH